MADWQYYKDPQRNARAHLINGMPRGDRTPGDTSNRQTMQMQMDTASIISDLVPRRQEDHPSNSQSYKQKDGEDY